MGFNRCVVPNPNQPMDALQAFICAVQLDKSHTPAWTNLGILYENCNQIEDALKCYLNASTGKGPINPNLASRVKILQNQISSASSNNNQRQSKLPCIEDAWNFPISQEMASRQNAAAQGQVNRVNSTNQRQPYNRSETPVIAGQGPANQTPPQHIHIRPSSLMGSPQDQPPNKRLKLTSGTQSPSQVQGPDANVRPPFFLNQQQLQLLSFFQQNQTNLSPQQRNLFQQLQQQYQHAQQHQQQQKMLLQNQSPTGQSSISVSTTGIQVTGTTTVTTPSIARSGLASGYMSPDSTATQVRPSSLMSLEGKVISSCSSHISQSNPANIQARTASSIPASQSCQVTTTTGTQMITKPLQYSSSHSQAQHLPGSRQIGTPQVSSTTQPSVVLHDICDSISDKDLQILLSQKDISSSLAEDLLMQFSGESHSKGASPKKSSSHPEDTVGHEYKDSFVSESDALKSSCSFPSSLQKRPSLSQELKIDFVNEKSEREELKSDLESLKFKSEPNVLFPGSLSINMSFIPTFSSV
ncbi:lysine-specific demethylase 6A [Trichonephila clavata]|uniref:Lysine-specific demethylase 6A n=1 Tax=Trichonephila clavata TaxID=2740835 RepID=A0A8X6HEV0_TRICU|nr:lysine-specific demethylase 6A [Trichonephila clavata]